MIQIPVNRTIWSGRDYASNNVVLWQGPATLVHKLVAHLDVSPGLTWILGALASKDGETWGAVSWDAFPDPEGTGPYEIVGTYGNPLLRVALNVDTKPSLMGANYNHGFVTGTVTLIPHS